MLKNTDLRRLRCEQLLLPKYFALSHEVSLPQRYRRRVICVNRNVFPRLASVQNPLSLIETHHIYVAQLTNYLVEAFELLQNISIRLLNRRD